jgi:aspartyl-tRNA(Asn)/glutamyl-tRNA(Gln) amidotransferase subunit A
MAKFYIFEIPLLTSPFNVSGHPAMSVCNGFSLEGLPVGMQIIGRPFDDAGVLATAAAYERETPFRLNRPVLK